jgi:hypothetical protein
MMHGTTNIKKHKYFGKMSGVVTVKCSYAQSTLSCRYMSYVQPMALRDSSSLAADSSQESASFLCCFRPMDKRAIICLGYEA